MNLSIVIPCFNERDNVADLRAKLLPVLLDMVNQKHDGLHVKTVEVVIVDDGSTDGTGDALKKVFLEDLDCDERIAWRVVLHEKNRGLGAALRTGFRVVSGDTIVTTDSDGTYRFEEIPALLSYLTPDKSIVTASPYHPQGGIANVPFYRLLLSRGSSLLYRFLVEWRIHTYTALFRAYRKEVVEHIVHEADGFLGGTELLVLAIYSGYGVAEYPTVLHSRVHGVSKAKIWRTIKAHLGFQRRILFGRLLPSKQGYPL